jgi:hypothetical protein
VKDVRKLIAKLVWESREEALFKPVNAELENNKESECGLQ